MVTNDSDRQSQTEYRGHNDTAPYCRHFAAYFFMSAFHGFLLRVCVYRRDRCIGRVDCSEDKNSQRFRGTVRQRCRFMVLFGCSDSNIPSFMEHTSR